MPPKKCGCGALFSKQKQQKNARFSADALAFTGLKETKLLVVGTPGANFDDVFAVRVGAADIVAVHPAVSVRLLHGVVCVNDIVAVVVFVGAVLYHVVKLSVESDFAAHKVYLHSYYYE